MTIPTDIDLIHLRRCIELAAEALEAGDGPFGSILVDGAGGLRAEDRNRETTEQDPTAHPKFALTRWAALSLSVDERAGATIYTSGEHCPMCAAAQGWVGVGRAVYVASSAQLSGWRSEWRLPEPPLRQLSISEVASKITVAGPADDLIDPIRALHEKAAHRDGA